MPVVVIRYLQLASSPGSLSSKKRRREPGYICRKSCRLPVPCSGGTHQIAEQKHVYTSTQQKIVNSKMSNELISVDYTSKGGGKQFLDVRKGRKSRESKNKVRCSWPTHSPYIDWSSSEFTCTQCVPGLNRAEDALKTRSKT